MSPAAFNSKALHRPQHHGSSRQALADDSTDNPEPPVQDAAPVDKRLVQAAARNIILPALERCGLISVGAAAATATATATTEGRIRTIAEGFVTKDGGPTPLLAIHIVNYTRQTPVVDKGLVDSKTTVKQCVPKGTLFLNPRPTPLFPEGNEDDDDDVVLLPQPERPEGSKRKEPRTEEQPIQETTAVPANELTKSKAPRGSWMILGEEDRKREFLPSTGGNTHVLK